MMECREYLGYQIRDIDKRRKPMLRGPQDSHILDRLEECMQQVGLHRPEKDHTFQDEKNSQY